MSRKYGFTLLALSLLVAFVISFAPAAHAAKPFKLGFSMALTGPLGPAGKAALLAMQIWRDDVNAGGGLLGRKVELVYYDDQTKPANVPGIYAKLLDVDKVDFVVMECRNHHSGVDGFCVFGKTRHIHLHSL